MKCHADPGDRTDAAAMNRPIGFKVSVFLLRPRSLEYDGHDRPTDGEYKNPPITFQSPTNNEERTWTEEEDR
eukprot:superscaffoldBa00009035_g23812